MEPEGLDDPALLAEIEAEFAELTAEIHRISAMPSNTGPRKSELLEALRASWRERLTARTGDRPEWRQKLDDTISKAVDRLLEDGIIENPDGSLGFALRGDSLKTEGGPLLRGLLDGFSNMLSERFPAPTTPASPEAVAANPLQSLLGGLGQMLAGALKSAVAQVGAQASGSTTPGSVTAEHPTDGGNVKIVVKPAANQGGDQVVKPGETLDGGRVEFKGDHEVAASFEIDTRSPPGETPTDVKGSETASTGPANPASATPNVFFQQLFAGLGQAVRQAITPVAPPAPAQPTTPTADTPQPQADGAEPADAATPTGAPPASGATPPPAPSPFAGLGQLFLNAIQKAFTPPDPNAAPPTHAPPAPAQQPTDTTAAPAEPEPSPEATPPSTDDTTPPESVPDVPPMKVKIPQVNAENPPAPGDPTPALNVDLAGLL